MSMAICGCIDLFLILQEAFRHNNKSRNCLHLSPTLHGFLDNFRWLATDLVSRPTSIAKLIPDCKPATNGAYDAAASGVGGVHFVPTDTTAIPLLWRQQFLDWIRQDLSSFANPLGPITNSNLELAGSIAQNDILAQAVNVLEKTTHILYDNTAVVYW